MFRLFKTSDQWFYSFVLANIAAGGTSLLVPLYAVDLGANVSQVGIILSIGSLIAIPASVMWGRLADKWGSRKYFVLLGFLGTGLLGGYLAHLLGYMAAFIAASIFVLIGLRIAFKALSTS